MRGHPLLVAAVADAACPPSPPLRRARCGYITRGGRGGWRSARPALSLSNSPGEAAGRTGSAPGWGARHGGPSLGAVGVRGTGGTPRALPVPCRTDPISCRKPGSPYRQPQVPPVQVSCCTPVFWGCGRAGEGRAEPVWGAAGAGASGASFLHVRSPPGRELRSGVSRVSPFSARGGRPLHRRVGAGEGEFVFLRCRGLLGPQRPLVRRPLSLRGDYLLAAALFCPGHGACVGCGSCAGKPQSPWSDRGMGPLALPLPAPGLTPPGPDPVPGWGTGTAGSSHRVLQPLGLPR